jgi:hypothetical protein
VRKGNSRVKQMNDMEEMKPVIKERYFIIFYFATTESGNTTGSFNIITKNEYVSRFYCLDYIKEIHKTSEAIINNIIELTKEDYDSWSATPKQKYNSK